MGKSPSYRYIALFLGLIVAVSLACGIPAQVIPNNGNGPSIIASVFPNDTATSSPGDNTSQAAVPTLTLSAPSIKQAATQAAQATQGAALAATALPTVGVQNSAGGQIGPGLASDALVRLHQAVAPGAVNILVVINQGNQVGAGAGSGFLLDDKGDIVTNNHVVADATQVTVAFYNGFQAEAKVLGTDPNSDLAVVRVDNLPKGVHPLPLGDSDQVQVGEWVVAIGNPFEESGTMTVGIVSAIGRTIPSGATQFNIPNAIQTDAAINPGNSGGPLIDMNGQVIGVNSQIETGGSTNASAGIGFAIPSNVVRKVAPVLINKGTYQWPWLGITGTAVTLGLAQANNLPTQQGAYIDQIVPNGPAAKAGLKGSTNSLGNNGIPTGGDVVIAADGKQISSFDDLLVYISNKNPGDKVQLTVLRGGHQQEVTVTLEPRPANISQQQSP